MGNNFYVNSKTRKEMKKKCTVILSLALNGTTQLSKERTKKQNLFAKKVRLN